MPTSFHVTVRRNLRYHLNQIPTSKWLLTKYLTNYLAIPITSFHPARPIRDQSQPPNELSQGKLHQIQMYFIRSGNESIWPPSNKLGNRYNRVPFTFQTNILWAPKIIIGLRPQNIKQTGTLWRLTFRGQPNRYTLAPNVSSAVIRER